MDRNVVTLETAEALKVAGLPGRVIAMWWNVGVTGTTLKRTASPDYGTTEQYAAPTAQEIADQLPHFTAAKLANGGFSAIPTRNSSQYYVSAATLAEALATLWLALHEALPSNSGLEGQEGPMPSHD